MNPDDLLSQIMDLCSQYIQAGGDPGQVVDAVTQATQGGGGYGGADQGAGGGQGGMPPTGSPDDQASMTSGNTPVPDMTGGMGLDQQQDGGFKDFGSAKMALTEAMKRKIKG